MVFVVSTADFSDFSLFDSAMNSLNSRTKIRRVFYPNSGSVSTFAKKWAYENGVETRQYFQKDRKQIADIFSSSFDLVSVAFCNEKPNDFVKNLCEKNRTDYFLYRRVGPSLWREKV
jgi:hypothetical protein